MNDQIDIPPGLASRLLSKTKGPNKLDFGQKVQLSLDWVGEHPAGRLKIGIFRNDQGNIVVNASVFSAVIDVKPRSLQKNFSIFGFHKIEVLEKGKWYVYSKTAPRNSLESVYQIPEGIPSELWSIFLSTQWNNFCKLYPEHLSVDFGKFIPSSFAGFAQIDQLIKFIYHSDIITPEIFCSIFYHFGPFSSVGTKLPTLFMSIISRGWKIGNEKFSVSLERPNVFVFKDETKSVKLMNDSSTDSDKDWLKLEDGSVINLEKFWFQYFPYASPSISYIAESTVKFL